MKQMQRIYAADLKEGIKFSAPVFFEDGENMFLAENKPLKKMHIAAMEHWNLKSFITYGNVIALDDNSYDAEQALIMEDITEEYSPMAFGNSIKQIALNLATANSEDINKFISIIKKLDFSFQQINIDNNLVRQNIDSISEELYNLVNKNWQDLVSYILLNDNIHCTFARAGVSTAVFSSILANVLGFNERKIKQLIIAALLHDVGMKEIPENILRKTTKLTKKEFEIIQLHPVRSAKYAENNLFYPKEIANIIVQHHERWDGKGYPEKLKENQIQDVSSVLAIADAFSAMVSRKSYRNSLGGYEAIKKLLDVNEQRFDSKILKAFVDLIGIYPIGSVVLLSNDSIAQVIHGNQKTPHQPDVRILKVGNDLQNATPGEILQLSNTTDISIIRALNQDEYRATA